MHVVIILALASELFALFDALPFNSVSGMLSYPLQKFWPQYKATLSVWTFLCVAAILLAWGYGPMTSQAGLEKQVKVLKVQTDVPPSIDESLGFQLPDSLRVVVHRRLFSA